MNNKILHTHVYEEFGSLITLRGSFNVVDIVGLHTKIYNHPNLEESNYFIINASQAYVDEGTKDVPQVIPQIDKAFANYQGKMNALFVSLDPEFIELYETYKNNLKDSGWNFKLFDTLAKVRTYLKSIK